MINICKNCSKETFTKSSISRIKKYCDNKCQLAYEKANNLRVKPERFAKELLEDLYLNKKFSILDISRQLSVSIAQVSRYFKRHNIQTRPFSTKGMQTRLGAKLSQETKDKIAAKHLGKKLSIEVRTKIGRKGKENPAYIDGRTPINKIIRHSIEYKLWRADVFERDNYTCVLCFQRGGGLQADHIKPFALYPELRLAIDNGRTLCVECHRKTDTFGARAKTI